MRNVVRAFALKSTVSHFICLADSQDHLWQVSNRPPYSSREYRSFRAPFVYCHHHLHSLQTTHTHSTPPHSPVTASQSTGTRHYLIKLAHRRSALCIAFTRTNADYHTHFSSLQNIRTGQVFSPAPLTKRIPQLVRPAFTESIFDFLVQHHADL